MRSTWDDDMSFRDDEGSLAGLKCKVSTRLKAMCFAFSRAHALTPVRSEYLMVAINTCKALAVR